MATTGPDNFRARARRAYEWGRLRHALVSACPALFLAAVSAWLCHEPDPSAWIGASLFALLTSLVWYGPTTSRAATAGLRAGMWAFALPVAVFSSHLAPITLSSMLIVNGAGGIGAGILLNMESSHLQTRRNLFLACASTVATLCGTLGCLLFGPIGLAGMAAGVLLSTSSFAIYRQATA